MRHISKGDKELFKTLGKVIRADALPRGVELQLSAGKGKILVYSPSLVRFTFTNRQEYELDHSYAVVKPLNDWSTSPHKIQDNSVSLTIVTEKLELKIDKITYKATIRTLNNEGTILCEDAEDGMGACFNASSSNVRSYKKMVKSDHFFGFGEKTGPLDKKEERMVMHGRDMPYKKKSDPMYQNHPFFISVSKGVAYGIFLDTISKTTFDMGRTNSEKYYFDAEVGDLNYYFIYGPTIDEILETYTELTGRIELPPKWALGYHQCRYSYKNETEVKNITAKFRKNKVPCDAIWYDIFYMDGYRCFTFNKQRFPDPKRLMEELKNDGFKSVVIVDPGIKIDPNYKIYQELVENKYFAPKKDGSPSIGLVWPGWTHFPDFTRKEVRDWWADKHEFYFEQGVSGIWNDMNEPALSINPFKSKVKRVDHEDMYLDNQGKHSVLRESKNIFAFCEAWATWSAFKKFKPNTRPFLLTRSGYCGIQRYAAIWTGDNWTNYYNIALAVRMQLNLNLSGQVFTGADIGGFIGLLKTFHRDKKQFARWIQTGVFYPFCRVHTALGSKTQDPFSYGAKVNAIAKKYIKLRYSLMPYLYNMFYEAHKKGKPILRPLFYENPNDEKCYDVRFENMFFLGKDLLIVPINKRRAKTCTVYLPEGKWIHYWTLEEFIGKKEYTIPVTLDDIPVFVRKGAILPFQPVVEYFGQKPIEELTLKIFKGDNGQSENVEIYEDDGESMEYCKDNIFCVLDIECKYKETNYELIISDLSGKFKPSWKSISYTVYEMGKIVKQGSIPFDGKKIAMII